MNDRLRSLLKELKKEYTEAESDIKYAENVHDQLSIPAINELRYAARNLLGVFCAEEEDKAMEEYCYAKGHITRARWDALEAPVLFLLGEIDRIKNTHNELEIIEAIGLTKYAEIKKSFKHAQQLLSQSVYVRHPDKTAEEAWQSKGNGGVDQLKAGVDELKTASIKVSESYDLMLEIDNQLELKYEKAKGIEEEASRRELREEEAAHKNRALVKIGFIVTIASSVIGGIAAALANSFFS